MLIGLCGKPSSGKSTFFKAATLAEVEIANYPFTTIKSKEGVGFVKVKCVENEFKVRCEPKFGYCINGERFVPVKLMDVPGLIEGSYKGLGRGNEFLNDLTQADAFIHIVDASGSTNEKGEQIKALSYDPCKDVELLENELDMWLFQVIKKGWNKFARKVKEENQDVKKALAEQLTFLKVTEDVVQDAIKNLQLVHHPVDWEDEDLKNLAKEIRKKTKPMIIAANKIDVEGAKFNLEKLKERFPDYIIIGCSAESELALREASKKRLIDYIPGEDNFRIIGESKLNEKQKKGLEFIKKFLKENKSTGVQDVLNKVVFELLKYICVYPVANSHLEDKDRKKLPDCFLVCKDIKAIDFAYKVHTDLGKNFIKAIDLKTKKIIGKEQRLKNNDVIEIVTK